jgi:hypothetical protein
MKAKTELMNAAQAGDVGAVARLLRVGASVHAQDAVRSLCVTGSPPLDLVAESLHGLPYHPLVGCARGCLCV